MKIFRLLFCLMCVVVLPLAAKQNQLTSYLLPEEHPAKRVLDELLAQDNGLTFYDISTMTQRGFDFAVPQPKTGIIVTRHPLLPGLVIKAYLDTQEYYDGKSEKYYWLKRVEGANLIRDAIKKYHYEHLLKVPRKWIYKLPEAPETDLPPNCYRKRYILVEDDMNILSESENLARWSSPHATKELLAAMHRIITEYRFRDLAKPANCPFCHDGRVAFVDTQSFYKKTVGYYKLTPYLTKEMQKYWKSMSHIGVKGE